jgi:hypothetical protein
MPTPPKLFKVTYRNPDLSMFAYLRRGGSAIGVAWELFELKPEEIPVDAEVVEITEMNEQPVPHPVTEGQASRVPLEEGVENAIPLDLNFRQMLGRCIRGESTPVNYDFRRIFETPEPL